MNRISRSVRVGSLVIGGGAPVTIQSMTNTKTEDAEATLRQIDALKRAGCDIVRMSVYNMDCVSAIRTIKPGAKLPLVADIHFDYKLAIAAANAGIDKLRINPGNIGSEACVRELVACCKTNGVPIRIGVNSGSVERGLLDRYHGPTPEAMVESALGHAAILEKCGFYDTVISIKASTVQDNITANRMLAARCDYPIHVGVTEAGMGAEAVIKGAIGIGSLLADGIGDTVRVSLTGDPVQEVPAAKAILRALSMYRTGADIVACPTCGRTPVDLEAVVKRVRDALPRECKPIRIAIMGCAVNGPGEAREADIGIAFGKDNAVVFRKGERDFAEPLPGVIDHFIACCLEMLGE